MAKVIKPAAVVPRGRVPLIEKQIITGDGSHLHPTFSFVKVDNTTDSDGIEFGWHLLDEGGSWLLFDFIVAISKSPWTHVRSLVGAGNRQQHRLHHNQGASTIEQVAQDRLAKYYPEMGDDLFRFHVDNLERLWGFEIDGVFYVVWWDPEHKVYALDD